MIVDRWKWLNKSDSRQKLYESFNVWTSLHCVLDVNEVPPNCSAKMMTQKCCHKLSWIELLERHPTSRGLVLHWWIGILLNSDGDTYRQLVWTNTGDQIWEMLGEETFFRFYVKCREQESCSVMKTFNDRKMMLHSQLKSKPYEKQKYYQKYIVVDGYDLNLQTSAIWTALACDSGW